jgi:hypothetical protein
MTAGGPFRSRHEYALRHASDIMKNDKEVVMAAVTRNPFAFRSASDALKNNPSFRLSMAMIGIRKRYRWRRLVSQVVKFEHDDKVFHALFQPALIEEQAEEICNGEYDDFGPKPSALWNAIINKRGNLSMSEL